MAFKTKIYLAVILAIVIAVVFFQVNRSNQALLSSHDEILHHLHDIELYNQQIDHEVLRSAFRLYNTYDVVNQKLRGMRDIIERIKADDLLQRDQYRSLNQGLEELNNLVTQKEQAFYRFATINSSVKNSVTQVASLAARFLQSSKPENDEYVHQLARISSSVFLARNAFDADMLASLDDSMEEFEDTYFDHPETQRFHAVFTAHVGVIRRYLPSYRPIFEEVTSSGLDKQIVQMTQTFEQQASLHAQRLRYLYLFVSMVLVAAVAFVISLLFSLESSHLRQVQLTDALHARATTDQLTGLPNRFAFEQQPRDILDSSAILLVNIDGFQSINDFYSHQVGDECLRFIAEIVAGFLKRPGIRQVFRVGSDEYAVLIERNDSESLADLAQQIIDKIETSVFSYEQLSLVIRVSLGISTHGPLLEKADLALRQIKSTRRKYLEYQPELALDDRARKNLTMMSIVREAIVRDLIEPHFMPIMNNKSREIVGYECLIRLRGPRGELHYPAEFLDVAKQARLYGELTKIMFKKCFDQFADNDYHFSLNLSIEDIEDPEVIEFILQLLRQRPQIGPRLTLEILESDGIENYQSAQSFIEQIKGFGCQIAIDDYGTGYSNLQHLLKLNADILKLDGTFIESLGKDVYSFVAVRAIVEMAQELGIHVTTAEFVSDEEIYMIVTSLGITNSQGYFIGRASETLQLTPNCCTSPS